MNDPSRFSSAPADCSSFSFLPTTRLEKAALVVLALLALAVLVLALVYRKFDASSSGAYIFTYKAVIPSFYLPGCVSEGAADSLHQHSEQQKKALEENARQMTLEEVRSICDSLHVQVLSTCAEVNDPRSAKLRGMLIKMKPFLSPSAQWSSVFLIECDFPNAFNLPDGRIYFTVPLYEALQTDEALAFVLAHELGHVENRHAFKILAKNNHFGRSLSEAFKPFLSSAQLHTDEMEADLAACYLTHEAGFDLGAAVGFLENDFRIKGMGENKIFKDLSFEHSFSIEQHDCLNKYLEIARWEFVNQWVIKSYLPRRTMLGLTWQRHQKKFWLAISFLAAIRAFVMLRRRRQQAQLRVALLFSFLIFLALAGACQLLFPAKKSSNNHCNCTGRVSEEKAVLREKPDAGSDALALMEHGEEVVLTSVSKRATLEGRTVWWRQVKWGNTTGWVWDWLVEKQGQEE